MKLLAVILMAAAWAAAETPASGWIALFDGQSLAGWEGDPDLWRVENGAIVGSTDAKQIDQNTFLIHREKYGDFHLRADVRLRNGNSGIQFRSTVQDGPGWVVTGYQADFSEDGERSAWGNLYEEKGRGRGVMKTPDEGWQVGKTLVRHGDWNKLEVIASGNRMKLLLNGKPTLEVNDARSATGVIALQLHRGPGMRVEVRDIRLRPLGEN